MSEDLNSTPVNPGGLDNAAGVEPDPARTINCVNCSICGMNRTLGAPGQTALPLMDGHGKYGSASELAGAMGLSSSPVAGPQAIESSGATRGFVVVDGKMGVDGAHVMRYERGVGFIDDQFETPRVYPDAKALAREWPKSGYRYEFIDASDLKEPITGLKGEVPENYVCPRCRASAAPCATCGTSGSTSKNIGAGGAKPSAASEGWSPPRGASVGPGRASSFSLPLRNPFEGAIEGMAPASPVLNPPNQSLGGGGGGGGKPINPWDKPQPLM